MFCVRNPLDGSGAPGQKPRFSSRTGSQDRLPRIALGSLLQNRAVLATVTQRHDDLSGSFVEPRFAVPTPLCRHKLSDAGLNRDVYDRSFLDGFFNDGSLSLQSASVAHGFTLKQMCARRRRLYEKLQPLGNNAAETPSVLYTVRGRVRSPETTPRYVEFFQTLKSGRGTSRSVASPTAASGQERVTAKASMQASDEIDRDDHEFGRTTSARGSEKRMLHGLSKAISMSSSHAGDDSGGHTPRASQTIRRSWSRSFTSQRGIVAVPSSEGLTPKIREACDIMRQLVFGAIGHEDLPATEKMQAYEQRQGTQAELRQLMELWHQLDTDGSGDIDMDEFQHYFSRNKSDKLLGMRCVRFLTGNKAVPEDSHGDGYDATTNFVTREDILRMIWPRATQSDLDTMHITFELLYLESLTVEPPPLLPKKRLRELESNFKHVDSKGLGSVKYSALVDCGLVDLENAMVLKARYDRDGDGYLDKLEFLEMVCPFGFRAHKRVTTGMNADGSVVLLCESKDEAYPFKGWLPEEVYEQHKHQFQLEQPALAS
eukprot:TRINITY_DN4149_c1_g1_i2.p1 TRINITY_DN4149_c1_g1~~TRINITY_DN4149_c1_g1_i2.p1  ORF type:complete len:543 (-),score=74.44 TRINITY_DN4149_c1_g1_i2:396-2024(-)